MVIQNLHISHDCELSLGTTPIPWDAASGRSNRTYPTFAPYGTTPHARLAFILAEVCFIALIVVGNLTIVITIWMKSVLRTPGFMYVVSVAVSHFLVGTVVIPMYIIGHVPHQHLSTAQCKTVEFVSCLASAASPYSAVALAIHRFREKALTSKTVTFKQFALDTCIVWVVSSVYALKGVVLYDMVIEVVQEDDTLHCVSMCEVPYSKQHLANIFILCDFILLYVIPFVLTATFYLILVKKVWSSTRKEDRGSLRLRDNLTRTVALFLVAFFISFLGIYCWNLYVYWGPGHFNNSLLWREILKLVSFISGWSNVALILTFNATFRHSITTHGPRRKVRAKNSKAPRGDSEEHSGFSPMAPSGTNERFQAAQHMNAEEQLPSPNRSASAIPSEQTLQDDNVSEYDNVPYRTTHC